MVEVVDLVFGYGAAGFRLEVPHFHAAAGERVALIGPSGSGKTTFLQLLAGIRVPARGRAVVGGSDLGRLSAAQRRRLRLTSIGLVFQEFELLEYLSVLDNILIACRLSTAMPLTADRRRVALGLAHSVGLADKLRRYPGELSQGEKQRVAICRALISTPPLILADEPTGNLDPVNKRRTLDLLLEHAVARGATLLAATHDHQLLDRFDRVVDMQALAGPSAQADAATSGEVAT